MIIEPIFETVLEDKNLNKILNHTYFTISLESHFDPDTISRISYALEKLPIPTPKYADESLVGAGGSLILSNKLSLAIRIEQTKQLILKDDIEDNGYILKPIASIKLKNATIRVCPAVNVNKHILVAEELKKTLKETSVLFWDSQENNVGNIPIKTPKFPKGVNVVIDISGVKKFSSYPNRIKGALEKEAEKAQDELYSPLRKAFKEAWNDKNKAPEFLSLCQIFKEQGKLIAGWNNIKDWYSKTERAAKAAAQYDKRLSI